MVTIVVISVGRLCRHRKTRPSRCVLSWWSNGPFFCRLSTSGPSIDQPKVPSSLSHLMILRLLLLVCFYSIQSSLAVSCFASAFVSLLLCASPTMRSVSHNLLLLLCFALLRVVVLCVSTRLDSVRCFGQQRRREDGEHCAVRYCTPTSRQDTGIFFQVDLDTPATHRSAKKPVEKTENLPLSLEKKQPPNLDGSTTGSRAHCGFKVSKKGKTKKEFESARSTSVPRGNKSRVEMGSLHSWPNRHGRGFPAIQPVCCCCGVCV